MKMKVPFKFKAILALLLAVAVMDICLLFFYYRIEFMIHGDLYRYGLQFNYGWANQYYAHSHLLISSLTIAIISVGLSMAAFLNHARNHGAVSRFTCCLLLIVSTTLTIFSAYLFNQIDYIVHHYLYFYGLQFSYEWAAKYWLYYNLCLALIGFASAITLTSTPLILFSTQKEVRINPAKLTYSTLITIGAIALTVSIIYTSSILALIGLGLLFWGIIFTYIRTEEYGKKALPGTTASSQLSTLNQIIQELAYKGNAIYLPPKYLRDSEANKAYISKQKEISLPAPEQIQQQENLFFIQNPAGILLTPPGAELARFFEKTFKTNFARVDLQYLQQNMPKLFIEDLEIAQNFEIETENNKIRVKIGNSTYNILNIDTEQSSSIYTLGSPLSSAIACALTKATGNPIIIEQQQTSKDGRDVIIEYRILEDEA
jgi:hypothetical protein